MEAIITLKMQMELSLHFKEIIDRVFEQQRFII